METKLAVGQTYRLVFSIDQVSKKFRIRIIKVKINAAERQRQRACVCILDGKENKMFASRVLVVVSKDGRVSDRLR